MSAADYLADLPPTIQHQLARIARVAVEMSSEERGYAAALFATVGLHFTTKGADEQIPGAEMVAALGVILRRANDEDFRKAVA